MVSQSKLGPSTDEQEDEEAEDDDLAVMVPMADMLNAAYQRDNARLYDDNEHQARPEFDGDGFTMITTRAVKEGEQIVRHCISALC